MEFVSNTIFIENDVKNSRTICSRAFDRCDGHVINLVDESPTTGISPVSVVNHKPKVVMTLVKKVV